MSVHIIFIECFRFSFVAAHCLLSFVFLSLRFDFLEHCETLISSVYEPYADVLSQNVSFLFAKREYVSDIVCAAKNYLF